MLLPEFWISKQTISKKQKNNSYFLILDMLLLFKRVGVWQILKSQSLNQTVDSLQLSEVGICTATGIKQFFPPLLLSDAESVVAETTGRWALRTVVPSVSSSINLPKLPALGVGLDHLFLWQLHYCLQKLQMVTLIYMISLWVTEVLLCWKHWLDLF